MKKGRPRIYKPGELVSVHLRLPKSLIRRIKEVDDLRGLTFGAAVRRVLMAGLPIADKKIAKSITDEITRTEAGKRYAEILAQKMGPAIVEALGSLSEQDREELAKASIAYDLKFVSETLGLDPSRIPEEIRKLTESKKAHREGGR